MEKHPLCVVPETRQGKERAIVRKSERDKRTGVLQTYPPCISRSNCRQQLREKAGGPWRRVTGLGTETLIGKQGKDQTENRDGGPVSGGNYSFTSPVN